MWNLEKNIPVREFSFSSPRTSSLGGDYNGCGSRLRCIHEIRAVLRSFHERYSRRYQPPVHVPQGTMSDAIANCRYSAREKERVSSCNEIAHLRNYKWFIEREREREERSKGRERQLTNYCILLALPHKGFGCNIHKNFSHKKTTVHINWIRTEECLKRFILFFVCDDMKLVGKIYKRNLSRDIVEYDWLENKLREPYQNI